ncbi:MAG: biopolymer transporter ExbD [Candidatus Aminicenantes bacterium]|nr:biopolymer transporter ExbD [Candidatus Aminicenantes bacterium]
MGPERREGGVESGEMELTPLIDCVFLLLIFFMVTTVFQEPYRLKVFLPEAEEAAMIEEKKLVATIDRAGVMEVNRHPVTMESVEGVLAREKEGVRVVTLIIRTDKETRHGLVLDLMETAKRIGIEKIVLATEKKAEALLGTS